ncbi:MAG: HAD family phosphatase [bacterium]|nr:HAD family phosphatase [bacterium]
MINAIIFDLDGTLVDSESLQYAAYNHAFSEYGYPISHTEWIEWSQNSYSAKTWIDKRQLPLDPEIIRAAKKKIYDELIREKISLKEGAEELIENIHGQYPLCLASSSRRESIEACLEKFGLKEKFQSILSGTELEKSKPNPDIYLKAAESIGQSPSQCLVFENSVSGLHAAKSAGMRCIICPDIFDDINDSAYQEADVIVFSLAEVTRDMIARFDK